MKFDIIKEVFWLCLSIMKRILSLAEFKLGKGSEDYLFFKKEVMDNFYNGLARFYERLVKCGYAERCECGASLRCGYKSCELCGGCGFKKQ